MSDDRPSWEQWAMNIAEAVATRADCRRRKVGAVVLNANNRIVATGYNGTAPGRDGCLLGNCPRGRQTFKEVPDGDPTYDVEGLTYCIATHAEMNALLQASPFDLEEATLVCTLKPCNACTKVISNTAVRRIIHPAEWHSTELVTVLV